MRKKVDLRVNTKETPLEFSLVQLLTVKKEDIHVFQEKPRHEEVTGEGARSTAHELFSLFTADIIKEKAVFVR